VTSIDDPKYKIAPGITNFTAWSRDNIPKGPPRFKVGDRVRFLESLWILYVGEDCDGEPLFSVSTSDPKDFTEEELANWKYFRLFGNYSADSFELVE